MAGRYYTIDGERYPSVTTILDVLNKPQLVNWAARLTRDYIKDQLFAFRRIDSLKDLNVDDLLAKSAIEHDRVKNAAADHGTDIHRRIAACVDDKYQHIAHDEDPVVVGFRTWQDSAQFLPIASEKLVFSLEYGYAGTTDLIGTVRNGKLGLLDIKTGRGVYPEYKLQLAAYAVAYGEMTGRFPEVCLNLHVRSDFTITEANTFTAAELFPLFQTFLAAKRLFEWQSEQPTSRQRNPQWMGQKVAASVQP
jgi:hypothetical protein